MNHMRLATELTDENGIPILRVHGEIDLYTVPEFRDALQKGIERKPKALIVDLTDISYIDSAGLAALLAAYKMLIDHKGKLYIISNPNSPGVSRVLEITRLDTLIPVRNSVEEACGEISSQKAA